VGQMVQQLWAAESKGWQNKYFKWEGKNSASTDFKLFRQVKGNSMNKCNSFKFIISVGG
jgi:hypothetical protein